LRLEIMPSVKDATGRDFGENSVQRGRNGDLLVPTKKKAKRPCAGTKNEPEASIRDKKKKVKGGSDTLISGEWTKEV